MESRRRSRDDQIYDTSFICGRLNSVRSSVFTEGKGTIVGIARKFLGVEVEVLQGIGGPEVRGFTVRVEDFRIELARGVYTASVGISLSLFIW